MKRLVLKPDGWTCTLEECPPGHFLWNGMVGFKSEYRTNTGRIEAFCDTGEYFCKEPNDIFQPLIAVWEEE